MSEAPFVDYGQRLAALESNAPALAAIEGAAPRLWQRGRTWTPLYGRFFPGVDPFAVQLFESTDGDVQRTARIDAFDAPPFDSSDAVVVRDPAVGYMRVTTPSADRELPALGQLLQSDPAARIVRYHPGIRCTIRTERAGRPAYAKLFHNGAGRTQFEDAVRLFRASASGELLFGVARPLEWDETTKTLWQVELPGYPLRPRLSSDAGPSLARRVGVSLASLACSSLTPARSMRAADYLHRSDRYAFGLLQRVPGVAPDLELFRGLLAALHARAEPGELRPIHGAPHPAQWLATSERLGLIDFDKFSAGDPEFDVATFLVDLEFESRLGETVTRLSAELVAGWQSIAGPLRPGRLAFYRAERHLRKAARRACALQPDAGDHAAASLRGSLQILDERIAL